MAVRFASSVRRLRTIALLLTLAGFSCLVFVFGTYGNTDTLELWFRESIEARLWSASITKQRLKRLANRFYIFHCDSERRR